VRPLGRARRQRVRAKLAQNLITLIVWVTYLGLGIAVSYANGYLNDPVGPKSVAAAVLAVVLWPIVFIE